MLQECINFEIKIADKICNFISLYRSPSQSKDKFESFADNLELNIDSIVHRNPCLILVLGDSNAQTKGWYALGKTTYEDTRIDGITSQFVLEQLIHEPTHIIGGRTSSMDLIFASQPNLVVESGVQSSLHQNCHHQIVFATFNLKVVLPPSYEREVWHFKKANNDHIRKAINGFQWEKSFQNMNVNDMVYLFNRNIKNILRNFIPHETVTCDDRDPPWINSSIRRLIQDKNEAYKHFKRNNNNNQYFESFQSLQNLLSVSTEASKERYYSHLSMKLMEPSTSPKTYWSVLKSFHSNKKIPCIPPIFHENRFVTNFKEKSECFNSFFAKQCSITDNDSEIPSFLHPEADKSLSNITFTENDIEKFIESLDPNKVHGQDIISIRMLKICGKSTIKPLLIIYKKCL